MSPHAWAVTFGLLCFFAAAVIAVGCLCIFATEELGR